MDVPFWTNQWGDEIILKHGYNHSAGVAICFNKRPGELKTHRDDGDGRWLTVVMKVEIMYLIITNIYGCNDDGQNKKLMENVNIRAVF